MNYKTISVWRYLFVETVGIVHEHSLLTYLAEDGPIEEAVEGDTFEKGFADDDSEDANIFKSILFIKFIIPNKFIGSFICHALLEYPSLWRKYLFDEHMHPLSEQSTCIMHYFIIKHYFELFM